MTTPENEFRIRIADGSWVKPSASTFPGILSLTPMEYANTTARTGLNVPTGADGNSEALFRFPPLSQTEYNQVLSLFTGVAAGQEYQNVEFEAIDHRANPSAYETWTGRALYPSKPTRTTTKPSGLYFEGVTMRIIDCEAT